MARNWIGETQINACHHATGRVAIIGGACSYPSPMFFTARCGRIAGAEKEAVYLFVYQLALIIPLVSFLAWFSHPGYRGVTETFSAQAIAGRRGVLGFHSEPPLTGGFLAGGLFLR